MTDEHDRPGEGSAVPARLDDEADSAARLSARRDAEHSAIAEIAYQALGLHDAYEVAQVCARRVAQTVDARYVIVLLLDDSDVLRVAGVEGPAAGAWAMGTGDPIESGAPVTATIENRAIICHDMLLEIDKGMVDLAGLLGVDSGVAVPIPGPDGARGVLTAARPGVGTFTRDDIGFLGSITALLGSALGRLDIEANLRRAAVHDSMTGLPNRILLADRLEQALNRSRRDGSTVALMLLDLDDFKLVNDSYGHETGDDLLRALALRLTGVIRPADTVARLGGDEFVLLCEGLADTLDALTLAERLREAWSEPFRIGDSTHTVSASIGLALASGGDSNAEAMLRQADAAMYRAKSRGRDKTDVYDEDMRAGARRRLELESDLRDAIAEDQLTVAYQPIFDLTTDRIVAVEALIRWTHPTKGPQLPSEFIPVAEVTGLISRIGAWVFDQACRQLAAWREEMPGLQLVMTVNLSPVQLRQVGLAEELVRVAGSHGLVAGDVFAEITEGVLLDDSEAVTRNLSVLAAEGVGAILDDFGVGYSALSYIHRVPLTSIKVDRGFVARLMDDRMAGAIIETVCTLAQRLGLSTVAEGIETPQQLERVRRLGCDRGQGFLLAEPMTPERVANLLASKAERRP